MVASFPGTILATGQRIHNSALLVTCRGRPWLPLGPSWREPCRDTGKTEQDPPEPWEPRNQRLRSPPPPHTVFLSYCQVSHSLWAPSPYSTTPGDLISCLPTSLCCVVLTPWGRRHNRLACFPVVNPFLDLFLILDCRLNTTVQCPGGGWAGAAVSWSTGNGV